MHVSVATNNVYFLPNLPFCSNRFVDVDIFCGKNGADFTQLWHIRVCVLGHCPLQEFCNEVRPVYWS